LVYYMSRTVTLSFGVGNVDPLTFAPQDGNPSAALSITMQLLYLLELKELRRSAKS